MANDMDGQRAPLDLFIHLSKAFLRNGQCTSIFMTVSLTLIYECWVLRILLSFLLAGDELQPFHSELDELVPSRVQIFTEEFYIHVMRNSFCLDLNLSTVSLLGLHLTSPVLSIKLHDCHMILKPFYSVLCPWEWTRCQNSLCVRPFLVFHACISYRLCVL